MVFSRSEECFMGWHIFRWNQAWKVSDTNGENIEIWIKNSIYTLRFLLVSLSSKCVVNGCKTEEVIEPTTECIISCVAFSMKKRGGGYCHKNKFRCQIKRSKSALGSSEDLFGKFVTHYHALFKSAWLKMELTESWGQSLLIKTSSKILYPQLYGHLD